MPIITLPRRSVQPVGAPVLDTSNSLSNGFFAGWLPVHSMFFGPGVIPQRATMTNPMLVVDPKYGIGQRRNDRFGSGIQQVGLLRGLGLTRDVTLVAVARPGTEVSSNALMGSLGQTSNGVSMAVEMGNGTAQFYGGRIYVGGTRKIGGTFAVPPERPVAVTAIRQRYGIEQALFVDGVKDPVVGNFTGQMISSGNFGNYNSGAYTEIYAIYAWDRALSDEEIAMLAEDPYRFFLADKRAISVSSYTSPELVYISTVGASVAAAFALSTTDTVKNVDGNSIALATASAKAACVYDTVAVSYGSSIGNNVAFSIKQATGVSSANSTVQATAVTVACANGASQGSAIVAGNAACVWHVAGNANGSATVTAVTAYGQSFFDTAGTSYGSSSASAIARAVANSVGSASGSASTTTTVQALTEAIGSALAHATVNGTGAMVITTTGAAVAASLAEARAQAVASTSGNSNGTSAAQTVCLTIFESVASGLSVSEVNAVTQSVIDAIAESSGTATVSGKTEGGVHYTASGDRFSVTIMFSPYEVTIDNKPYDIAIEKRSARLHSIKEQYENHSHSW